MEIRAICTDIDGTLLDSQRQLSLRTISVISSLNIPVILASSRMPSAIRHLQRELNIFDHPLICYNGGYSLFYAKENAIPEVITTVGISPQLASSIYSLTVGTDIHTSLYREDDWHAPAADYWTAREERITKVKAIISEVYEVIRNWESTEKPIHKIMCMGPEAEIHSLEQTLIAQYNQHIHIYRSRPTYLELAPKEISKASALALVLKKKYGIQMNDVIAFGDNYNDIDLLQSVGLGIAVGNAKPEVKAVAKEITLPNVEDGVAISIEKYCR